MTNAEFEKILDTSDERIVTRTGIRERRIADDSINPSDMAMHAARQALEMSGIDPNEIEFIVVGTVTPDYRLPSTACLVQEKLGLSDVIAFDIVAACTGFISGLTVASAFLENRQYKKALVIGSEKLSGIVDFSDRSTCVLFGDWPARQWLPPITTAPAFSERFCGPMVSTANCCGKKSAAAPSRTRLTSLSTVPTRLG